MLVSPLRCFKVSSLTTPPLIWGGARRAEGMSILISPLGRTIITYLAFARTIATYLPFGSNDCYKVSKFHAS